MVLYKIRFIRFNPSDIDVESLAISAEEFRGDDWCSVTCTHLDAILDFTIPVSKRTPSELKLLSSIPHSHRIDHNRYELLQLISSDGGFKNSLLTISTLNSYEDLIQVSVNWEKIAIKSKSSDIEPGVIIATKQTSQWTVWKPYEKKTLSNAEMKEYVETTLVGNYFLQEYLHATSIKNYSLAFNLVVQQRFDSAWLTPIVRGYIATEGPIASLKAGAEFIGTPLLMDDVPYLNFKYASRAGRYLNLKIQRLAISVCRRLEKIIGAPFATLGLRIAVDKDLNPYILALEPRTNAQSGPGRHLEFYRHLTEFAIGLTQKTKTHIKEYRVKHKTNNFRQPLHSGFMIKGLTKENDIDNILAQHPEWLELSIGHGGRQFIHKMCLLSLDKNNPYNPFLSIKIGNALNERKVGEKPSESIIALEDYLGSGLINWHESEYMRSIRVPLLSKQWQQLSPSLQGLPPDIIWLDEADLGISALPHASYQSELSTTIRWFEKLCTSGQARSWGISFFNCKSPFTIKILEILSNFDLYNSNFNFVAIRMKVIDPICFEHLIKLNIHVVILSDDIRYHELKNYNQGKVSILSTLKNISPP